MAVGQKIWRFDATLVKINQYYIKQWKKKKSGKLLEHTIHGEMEITAAAWKAIDVKGTSYQSVKKMQENAYIIGKRKAAITGNPKSAICWKCKGNQIATIEHILLNCKDTQTQLMVHDKVAEEVWKAIKTKITKVKWMNKPITEKIFGYKGIVMYWNKEIMPRNDGKYPKKPDITVINMNNHEAQLYDVTIVADCNIKKAYIEKKRTYHTLKLRLKEVKNMIKVYVIPIVITINGIINEATVSFFESHKIKINWPKIIKDTVLQNMKRLINYLGDHQCDSIGDVYQIDPLITSDEI